MGLSNGVFAKPKSIENQKSMTRSHPPRVNIFAAFRKLRIKPDATPIKQLIGRIGKIAASSSRMREIGDWGD
jgi:hypothetical protein